MATWNRYQLASGAPKRAASQDEYDDRDRLAAMDSIQIPDDDKAPGPGYGTETTGNSLDTVSSDSYVRASPGGDVGDPDAGANDPGDLLPGIQGQLDNFVADDDPAAPPPAQGPQFDAAALQQAQAAERAAAQAQMRADRQGALGDLSARMGLGGLGLSGATGAALGDAGRRHTRDETLALADLDRKYRDEGRLTEDRDRSQGFEDIDRERDMRFEDEDRGTSAADRARGDGQEDEDRAWQAKQREIAIQALEDEYGVDFNGDGTIGFPSAPGEEGAQQAADDAEAAVAAGEAQQAQELDDLQSDLHGDPSADGATSLDPVPTTEGLNVVERDDVPAGAKSAGQVEKADGLYDVFYAGTDRAPVYYFVKVG